MTGEFTVVVALFFIGEIFPFIHLYRFTVFLVFHLDAHLLYHVVELL